MMDSRGKGRLLNLPLLVAVMKRSIPWVKKLGCWVMGIKKNRIQIPLPVQQELLLLWTTILCIWNIWQGPESLME
jgi:hypothetical protein